MQLTNEFKPIRDWAEEKGIFKKGDSKTQTIKALTELGELGDAVLANDLEEIKDAIGDVVVVLTSVAHFNDLTIEECINSAYNVIKNRKGKMENGSFVKDIPNDENQEKF